MTSSEIYTAILKDRKKAVKRVESLIEETYSRVILLYSCMDNEISLAPHKAYSIRQSYSSKVGAWVVKRNKLKKELEQLNG